MLVLQIANVSLVLRYYILFSLIVKLESLAVKLLHNLSLILVFLNLPIYSKKNVILATYGLFESEGFFYLVFLIDMSKFLLVANHLKMHRVSLVVLFEVHHETLFFLIGRDFLFQELFVITSPY